MGIYNLYTIITYLLLGCINMKFYLKSDESFYSLFIVECHYRIFSDDSFYEEKYKSKFLKMLYQTMFCIIFYSVFCFDNRIRDEPLYENIHLV